MSHARDDTRWITQGRQKRAVAQALAAPRTASQLWRVAQQTTPKLQLRDVWSLLQHFRERGLVVCLNPGQVPGQIYSLTPHGRQVLATAFPNLRIESIPPQDWSLQGWLARGPLRKNVFDLLRQSLEPLPACEIRRRLLEKHPAGPSAVLRVLKDLRRRELLAVQTAPVLNGRHRDRWRRSSSRFSLRPTHVLPPENGAR